MLLAFCVALSRNSLVFAQAINPATIRQEHPSFLVHLDVDKPTRTYREGDALRVHAVCERDSYLYLLYQQADGRLFQIFPNLVQKDNLARAGRMVTVPALDDRFRWQIGAPFGKETLKIIATHRPLVGLTAIELTSQRFNPVAAKQLTLVKEELARCGPTEWAEDQIEITTVAGNQPDSILQPRRFGLFFGISKYLFNEAYQELNANQDKLDRMFNASSAQAMHELLEKHGRMDATRLYVDEQATRSRMESSITEWLPSISRPGDTIIIYFNTHGAQIVDDNGDEPDGLDEFLLSYETADVLIWETLKKQKREGRLPAHLKDRLDVLQSIAAKSPSQKHVDLQQTLVRLTGVTDDLFGHWLQKLAGRQILVILDACHSGGMAGNAKSLKESSRNAAIGAAFDFLDGEIKRLKDIGQPECALIAACNPNEETLSHRIPDSLFRNLPPSPTGGTSELKLRLSVTTYCLVDALLREQGPIEAVDAYEICRQGVAEYLSRSDAQWPGGKRPPFKSYTPVLFNMCTRPCYLKPPQNLN